MRYILTQNVSLITDFKSNIVSSNPTLILPNGVDALKLSVKENEKLLSHLKILLPYFCYHPRRILDEISLFQDSAVESLINELYESTQKKQNVWHGLIGEVLATAYVLSFTAYQVPIFKLRFASNRIISMPGDDLLGFKFTSDGKPFALLILEAKNYLHNSKAALHKAYETLMNVKKTKPVLLDFIISELDHKGDYNQARLVQRYLDHYNYSYLSEFTAFLVTDTSDWRDEYYLRDNGEYATPLSSITLLINSWEEYQTNVAASSSRDPKKMFNVPDIKLDDESEVENLLKNELFKSNQSNLASATLAADLRIDDRERIEYKFDQNKLLDAAVFLSNSAHRMRKNNPKKSEEILKQAAQIYERIATKNIEIGDINAAINSIINGAVCYSVAGYNANAKVLVDKLSTRDTPINFENIIQQLLFLLISGKLTPIQDRLFDFLLVRQTAVDLSQIPENLWFSAYCDKLSDVCEIIIAKCYLGLLQFLRTGNVIYLESFEEKLEKAAEYFSSIGKYQLYHLTYSTKRIFLQLINNSTQKIVGSKISENKDTWVKHIRLLTYTGKFPMITLWKSQQKVIEEGLLGENSLVISMPTSSGKTRTVELAIFKAILDNPEYLCIYVVPTRALASEIEESLSNSFKKHGIGVSALYGGYDINSFDEALLLDNQVLIVTPEKVDILLRNNSDFRDKLKLIIIDEVHDTASAEDRGLRTEFIYSRLFRLAQKNTARILCLSAVVNNPEDFAQWISGNSENKIVVKWKPTNVRYGIFEWYRGYIARVRYFPHAQYPTEEFYVPLLFRKNDLINSEDFRKIEIVARLGIFYSQTGSTLIFTTTKNIVDDIVDCLSILRSTFEPTEKQLEIAKSCAQILGDDHKLVGAVKKGYCYHHSNLPKSIRHIIETAVKENIIPLIVSTTTLSQGVNLPIKNILVHSLHHGNTISMSQFWNVAGRAGRAGFETEGHVIFCFKDDVIRINKEGTTEKCESFIYSGLSKLVKSRLPSLENNNFLETWALASTKQFRNNSDSYGDWSTRLTNNAKLSTHSILDIVDSQLIAWIIDVSLDEVTDENISPIFDHLLCSVQLMDLAQEYLFFKEAIKRRIQLLTRTIPLKETQKLYSSTGLGINGNQIISDYTRKIAGEMDRYAHLIAMPIEFWKETHELFQNISELKSLSKIDVNILISWINGNEYKQIADLYLDGNIEKTVNQIESLIYSYPWGLSSLIQHLKQIVGEDLPEIIKLLPSFSLLGVSDLPSIYSIQVGIKDRECAILLGKLYSSLHENMDSYSLVTFKQWIIEYGIEKLTKYFIENGVESERVDEVLRRFKENHIELRGNRIFKLIIKHKPDPVPDINNLIVVNRNGKINISTYNFSYYSELEGDDLSYLSRLDRRNRELIITNVDFENSIVEIGMY